MLPESMAAELLPAQVGRETEVDCALAELYVRTMATDRLVKDTAQAEIFNSIFSRMNEVQGLPHGQPAEYHEGAAVGSQMAAFEISPAVC